MSESTQPTVHATPPHFLKGDVVKVRSGYQGAGRLGVLVRDEFETTDGPTCWVRYLSSPGQTLEHRPAWLERTAAAGSPLKEGKTPSEFAREVLKDSGLFAAATDELRRAEEPMRHRVEESRDQFAEAIAPIGDLLGYTAGEAEAIKGGLPPAVLTELHTSKEWAELLEHASVRGLEVGTAEFRRGAVIWVDLPREINLADAADSIPEHLIAIGVAWPLLLRQDTPEVNDEKLEEALGKFDEAEASLRIKAAEAWGLAIGDRRRWEDSLIDAVRADDPDRMLRNAALLLDAGVREYDASHMARQRLRHP